MIEDTEGTKLQAHEKRKKTSTSTKKEVLDCHKRCGASDATIGIPNVSSTLLDSMVIEFLTKLKKQADRFYKVNVTKARAKRTYVCGLHESLKHLKADNVKCVIVARNFDAELFEGLSLFHRLRIECFNRSVPIVHASSKRSLARALKKFPYTNVIALFHFQAFEELYRHIIQTWQESDSHIHYHIDQPSLFA